MTFISLIPPIYVNVTQYGALGDGTTDNTTFIQNAQAALPAAGGVLFFPPGRFISAPITLKNHQGIWGAGERATILQLKNASNASFITNFVSPDGIQANAQYVSVRDLMIDGNKANQTGTSHGIYFTTNPLFTQATNDDDYDSHQLVENVFIYNCLSTGYFGNGRSANRVNNVDAYYCDGNGFNPSFDTFLLNCQAGNTGNEGWLITQSQVHLTNCDGFYSGRLTPSLGYGFHITSGLVGVNLANCIAQDNKASGFVIDTASKVTLAACIADSNSTSSSGTYPGLDLWSATDCDIQCVCFDRKADGTNTWQKNALMVRNNSTDNRIDITHSAANGAAIGNAISSSSTSLAGNDIRINHQGGIQTPAFVATYVPDPYSGTTEMTLTGNITINVPTNTPFVPGLTMTLILIQDATGGRTTTFGAGYKVNWTPVTTANLRNIITFMYDGTNWNQISSATGM